MKSARKNTDLLDEGCQYIEDLMLEDILSRGPLTMILLNEEFTRDDFEKLISTINTQKKRLPEQMINTRESLEKAVEESQKSVKEMRAAKSDQRSKEAFAQVTAKIASMGTTLQNVINGLKKIEGLQDLMSGPEVEYEPTIEAALKAKGKAGQDTVKEIEQLVRTNFKPQGFLANLFGGGGEAEYFGLTSELFINDIADLRTSGLSALLNGTPLAPEEFISQDDAETLADEAGVAPETSAPAEEGPAKNVPRPSLKDIKGELKDGAKFNDKQIDAILSVLRNNKVQMESRKEQEANAILERWRHMAGITEDLK